MKTTLFTIIAMMTFVSCNKREEREQPRTEMDSVESYEQNRAKLRYYDALTDKKLSRLLGERWIDLPQSNIDKHLSPVELTLQPLRFYYETALVNSGDVFGYVSIVYNEREAFEAIGAHKTIAAAERLRPYFDIQQRLKTQDEKDEYWHSTRDERAVIESQADSSSEFVSLLIEYSRKNEATFTLKNSG